MNLHERRQRVCVIPRRIAAAAAAAVAQNAKLDLSTARGQRAGVERELLDQREPGEGRRFRSIRAYCQGSGPMDDIEGCRLAEEWEHLAELFRPPSEAVLAVTLTAAAARMVHGAMLLAGALSRDLGR